MSYRVGGKVKKRTLLNLSDWPTTVVEGLRALLKGSTVLPSSEDAITIRCRTATSRPCSARCEESASIVCWGPAGNRCRDLVVARLIAPISKLATAKALDPATAGFEPRWTVALSISVTSFVPKYSWSTGVSFLAAASIGSASPRLVERHLASAIPSVSAAP